VWGVGIERRLYYDEPLSLFTQVNSRQVAELLLSTLSLLKKRHPPLPFEIIQSQRKFTEGQLGQPEKKTKRKKNVIF
jgi:hypothetical protein